MSTDAIYKRGDKMKIKQINSQHRRDLRVDYECEHCGFIKKAKRIQEKVIIPDS